MSPTQRPSATDPVDRPRPGREPDGATFDTARVAARRAGPPIFLLGFAVLLGGVVALGVSGQGPAASLDLGSPAAAGSSIDVGETLAPASSVPSPEHAPIITTDGPIALKVRRHPESTYVHGDVYLEKVTWVFVSLQDPSGRIAGWASVSVPGAAGPGVDGGPNLRFDLEVAVPRDLVDRSIAIQATAYDSAGRVVASSRVEVDPDGAPSSPRGAPGVEQGSRPGVFFPLLDASWDDLRSTPPSISEIAPVRLERPDARLGPITGNTVPIRGELQIRAASMRIELRTADGSTVASTIVDTTDPDGGVRPRHRLVLDVELQIPKPRPDGWTWIVFTAYDAAGAQISEMHRGIDINARTPAAG